MEIIKTNEFFGEGTLASMDVLNEDEVVLGLYENKAIIMPLIRTRSPMVSIQQNPVLKVSRENDRLFWACMNTSIKLLDTRCIGDEVVFDGFGDKLGAFAKLSDFIFAYGGDKRVGLGDRRFNKQPLWKDDETHLQEVRDLVVLGRNVFSCGMDGRIVKWTAL